MDGLSPIDGDDLPAYEPVELPAWLNAFGEEYVDSLRALCIARLSQRFVRSPTGMGMCAPASEISSRIFQRRGHQALTMRCDAMFLNARAFACLREGRDVSTDPDAWSEGQ